MCARARAIVVPLTEPARAEIFCLAAKLLVFTFVRSLQRERADKFHLIIPSACARGYNEILKPDAEVGV